MAPRIIRKPLDIQKPLTQTTQMPSTQMPSTEMPSTEMPYDTNALRHKCPRHKCPRHKGPDTNALDTNARLPLLCIDRGSDRFEPWLRESALTIHINKAICIRREPALKKNSASEKVASLPSSAHVGDASSLSRRPRNSDCQRGAR